MIKQFLAGIEGAPIVASLVLSLFFLSFVYIVWKTIRLTPQQVKQMSEIPLDKSAQSGRE